MTLSFELSPQLAEYGRNVREWSVDQARPYAREADDTHAPPEKWRTILDTCPIGIGRVDVADAAPIPTFPDGDKIALLVFHEALNYGDVWVEPVLGAGIGHLPVKAMGTAEQIARWYDPVMATGATTGFALTEPQFGSDTSQIATTAVRDGGTWVLNGTKIYCTGGAIAEYVTVFATTDKSLGAKAIAAFVVPAGTPGFVVAKANESKLGLRSSITSELLFDNCVIPLENRLGWTADGHDQSGSISGQAGALSALADNRPNVAAMAIGLAQASLDVTEQLLGEQRASFSVQRWAAVEADLSRMNHALDRGRRVGLQAQYLVDHGRGDRAWSAMAKAFSPQTADRIIRRCMQLLGPDGTSTELLLEKWYRDVKIMDIFEGSGQIQRLVVGRTLMGRLVG